MESSYRTAVSKTYLSSSNIIIITMTQVNIDSSRNFLCWSHTDISMTLYNIKELPNNLKQKLISNSQ